MVVALFMIFLFVAFFLPVVWSSVSSCRRVLVHDVRLHVLEKLFLRLVIHAELQLVCPKLFVYCCLNLYR